MIKLTVDQQAAEWYKKELSLKDGDSLRIFARLGGCGSVQPGFSLGIGQETPRNPALQQQVDGILFFMETDNTWYLDDKALHLHYDEVEDEVVMDVL